MRGVQYLFHVRSHVCRSSHSYPLFDWLFVRNCLSEHLCPSRFVTRPDVKKQKLAEFLDWSLETLTKANGNCEQCLLFVISYILIRILFQAGNTSNCSILNLSFFFRQLVPPTSVAPAENLPNINTVTSDNFFFSYLSTPMPWLLIALYRWNDARNFGINRRAYDFGELGLLLSMPVSQRIGTPNNFPMDLHPPPPVYCQSVSGFGPPSADSEPPLNRSSARCLALRIPNLYYESTNVVLYFSRRFEGWGPNPLGHRQPRLAFLIVVSPHDRPDKLPLQVVLFARFFPS